jgi:hypothetical protein
MSRTSRRILATAGTLIVLQLAATVHASSLRFFGNGSGDIDRVKIRVDDPANSQPGPPADVGATDFTIEFWMRADSGNNGGPGCTDYSWIFGNTIIDRDRNQQGAAFGLSTGNGGFIAFGVSNPANTASNTICSTSNLLDGQWHHIAAQRRRSDGRLSLYVDGNLESQQDGPDGDVSYPDAGVPLNVCGPFQGDPCTNSDPFIVVGAEKHDAGASFPSYRGWLDELRISTVLRYTANFTPVRQPFTSDAATAALYHFDEGSGDTITDSAAGGASPGVRRFGGSPAGPAWSSETPFAANAGSLQLAAGTFNAAEGSGTLTINVTRAGGSSGAVTVNYATANGTALAGVDYVTSTGTLSWPGGDSTARSISIPIMDDVQMESAETFSVALSAPSGGATLGTPASATVTIADNDSPGTLRFTAATFQVSEGAGSASVTVSRSGGSVGAASVTCSTANGTATAPADYTTVSSLLTWSAGDSANKTCSVPIVDDAAPEGSETLQLSLSGASGASLGSPATATLTINDNDVPPAGSLQFTNAAFTGTEGAAAVTISVSRSGGSSGAVTVNYATSNGTATAPGDYASASGTLSWASGNADVRTFTVMIADDALAEAAESVNVTLSGATGGATIGNPGSATLTIQDNDAATPGTLQFAQASDAVTEGTAALRVSVSRSGGSDGAASVQVSTANGSAVAGQDFTGTSTTLNWAAGDATPREVDIAIADDTVSGEGTETFTVLLSAANGAALGSPDMVTVSLTDNEPPTQDSGDSGGGGGSTGTLLLSLLTFLLGRRLQRQPDTPC